MSDLSPRESEIIALIAAGELRKTIAHKLDITPKTVGTHVENAVAKLGAKNTVHAVAIWTRRQCETGELR